MINFSSLFVSACLFVTISPSVRAQSLVSGFMAGKGHGSVVVSATTEHYQSAYLAPDKANPIPVFQEVQVNSLNLYATYGLTDKIDAVISLPYIQARGHADDRVISDLAALYATAGYTNVRQGLQDVTGLLKFKTYSRELGGSVLDLLGAVSFTTPASNYQTNTGYGYIIAIGNRATKYTAVGVAHLKTSSGVFATGQVGYSLRTGQVPNALIGEARVGYAGAKIYLEGFASFQESKGGLDILQADFKGFFPATRVSYVRLGASVFRPIAKGVGVVVGAATYVAGRNIGKSTAYSLGGSYNF
ncbi:hypothetical protein IC235_13385 [Hymenobacter sp. BT664]|uniref:Uncharacterized protein n=1 Tax=Hymenobacter montanus TaxID=2771359 RepID=A0A927GK86_9BACT|nr:hypothetical protein [Hymenobacter montanus]MBD2768881.1 hypothetical protein [Hymenobacter montanus]